LFIIRYIKILSL